LFNCNEIRGGVLLWNASPFFIKLREMSYKVGDIIDDLYGVCAWRQNEDPGGWQLDSVVTPDSGLYFNEVHPLLTFDNIVSVAPEYDILFSGDDPGRDGAFSDWLERKTKAWILEGMNRWMNRKLRLRTGRNLLEDREDLFDVSGNLVDYDSNDGRIVGFEVIPPVGRSVKMKVRKIGLQMEENQTVIVKIFESGKVGEYGSESCVYNQGGGVQWFEVNWELDGGKSYWIVYDQGAISGRSINGIRDYNFNNFNVDRFPGGRFYCVRGVYHNEGIGGLWDLKENVYTLDTNYGLNLNVDVRCDYGDFIVDQKDLFKELIWLSVGMGMLKLMANNPDALVNRNQKNISWNKMVYEIDGDTQGDSSGSMKGRLERVIESLDFDTTGIDKICLPCRKRGIIIKKI
jgi:hypothetical protein